MSYLNKLRLFSLISERSFKSIKLFQYHQYPSLLCYPKDNRSSILSSLYGSVPQRPNLGKDIDFNELVDKLKENKVILIDVRSLKENAMVGSVPGSLIMPLDELGDMILLPNEEFKKQFGIDKPPNDKVIVTMCLLGIRARTAQLALVGAGYPNVRRYGGSFVDWKEKGGEIISKIVI